MPPLLLLVLGQVAVRQRPSHLRPRGSLRVHGNDGREVEFRGGGVRGRSGLRQGEGVLDRRLHLAALLLLQPAAQERLGAGGQRGQQGHGVEALLGAAGDRPLLQQGAEGGGHLPRQPGRQLPRPLRGAGGLLGHLGGERLRIRSGARHQLQDVDAAARLRPRQRLADLLGVAGQRPVPAGHEAQQPEAPGGCVVAGIEPQHRADEQVPRLVRGGQDLLQDGEVDLAVRAAGGVDVGMHAGGLLEEDLQPVRNPQPLHVQRARRVARGGLPGEGQAVAGGALGRAQAPQQPAPRRRHPGEGAADPQQQELAAGAVEPRQVGQDVLVLARRDIAAGPLRQAGPRLVERRQVLGQPGVLLLREVARAVVPHLSRQLPEPVQHGASPSRRGADGLSCNQSTKRSWRDYRRPAFDIPAPLRIFCFLHYERSGSGRARQPGTDTQGALSLSTERGCGRPW